jgi:simple sugar transport system permease protein
MATEDSVATAVDPLLQTVDSGIMQPNTLTELGFCLFITVIMISGAQAGLAGVLEAAGPIKQLQPGLSPGYGFTAIIVAFLGRLNPIGCLFAGIFIAITFIGGENAQIMLRLPLDATRVLQGLLLFFVLACDSLLLYRFRLLRGAAA